jgi:hypothetical protein
MSKKELELLSKNAYAAYLGINEKAVRKAVTEGKIKKGWDEDKQKIIKHIADREYGFLHSTPKAGPGVSKAKVVEKLSPKKEHDKVSKTRTEFGLKSEVAKILRKSEVDGVLVDADIVNDLSSLGTADLLSLLSITADMDYKAALTTNEILEAALKKKKLEELEDILVRKVNVEAALYSFGSQLRKALLNIPARVMDDIMHAENKVDAINILTAELTETLDTYSNIDKIKLSNKN